MITWNLYIIVFWFSIISPQVVYLFFKNKGVSISLKYWFIVIFIPLLPFILLDYLF